LKNKKRSRKTKAFDIWANEPHPY